MKVNGYGAAITRSDLIDELATGHDKQRIADRLGYAEYRSINRRMKDEKLTRHMLPCGVPLIIAGE